MGWLVLAMIAFGVIAALDQRKGGRRLLRGFDAGMTALLVLALAVLFLLILAAD